MLGWPWVKTKGKIARVNKCDGPIPGKPHASGLSSRPACWLFSQHPVEMPTPGVEVRDLEIPVEFEQRNRQKSEGAAG